MSRNHSNTVGLDRNLTIIQYAAAVVICLCMLAWILRLWRADLRVPFNLCGDSLCAQSWVKGVADNGWYLHNPYLGAPFAREMYDFPLSDHLHLLVMKGICLISRDPAFAYNAYFLLTFPLTTLSSLFVLRRLHLSYPPALVIALLFTFLPYHFFRGEGHLFLAAYYLVPLMVLVILRVYLDECFLVYGDDNTKRTVWNILNPRVLGILAFCLFFASAGIYYAFFACFFLGIAGLAAAFAKQRLYPLWRAAILVAAITLGAVASVSPTLLYHARHGANHLVAKRVWWEAELYALKIDHLLTPISEHRIGSIARAKARYLRSTPLAQTNNENTFAALGIVGSVGFLVLVGRLLYRRPKDARPELLDGLALLNIFAVLLGTLGGFGALVSLLGFAWIRCYNRISLYIAFFALLAVGLLLERLARRYVHSPRARLVYGTALATLAALGVLDQTSNSFVPSYAASKEFYQERTKFVQQIEAALPASSMVFQLPYMPFPEWPAVHQLVSYDHLSAYMHSRTLRWSYGAMKGRQGDQWQRAVTAGTPEALIRNLSAAGFNGIYLDRNGYADQGAEMVARLSALLGPPALESADQRIVFFNMTDFNRTYRHSLGEPAWELKHEAAMHPVRADWQSGFSHPDGTGPAYGRCCAEEGTLYLENDLARPRRVSLSMTFHTGTPGPSHLRLEGPGISRVLDVSEKPTPLSATLAVPPGGLAITFTCDATRVNAPRDPRIIVFRVEKFSYEELDEPQAASGAGDASACQTR